MVVANFAIKEKSMEILKLFIASELIKDTLALLLFGLEWLNKKPLKEGELENFKC